MNQSTQTSSLPLKPIHLPQEPGMWPLPWGYWAILAVAIISVCFLVWMIRHHKKRSKAKVAASNLIKTNTNSTPSSALEVVRQAALSYFPREDIAKLTGEKWLSFLDSQLDQPRFANNHPQWQQVLYTSGVNNKETNQALVEDCLYWVEKALPPKRKYRNWKQS